MKIQPCSTDFKSAIYGKPRARAALSCQFTFFLAARPRLLVNLLLLSIEAALRRGDLPFLPPSGFSIHHELFPVPSFCTRTKRLCSDRLCLMEFCRRGGGKRKAGLGANAQRARCLPFSPNHRVALVCECKSMLAGGSHRLKRAIFKVNRKTNAIRGAKETRAQTCARVLLYGQSILSRSRSTAHSLINRRAVRMGPSFPSQKTRGPIAKHF